MIHQKRHSRSSLCLGLILSTVLISVGCNKLADSKQNLRGSSFPKEAFGTLPKLPGGEKVDKFSSTIDSFGISKKLVAKDGVVLKVGDDFRCPVTAGRVVDLISDVGNLYLIHVQNKDLDPSCVGLSGEFSEGYAAKENLVEATSQNSSGSDNYPAATMQESQGADQGYESSCQMIGIQNPTLKGRGHQSGLIDILGLNQAKALSPGQVYGIPGESWRKAPSGGGQDFYLVAKVKGSAIRLVAKIKQPRIDILARPTKPVMKEVSLNLADLVAVPGSPNTYAISFGKFVERPSDWINQSVLIEGVGVDQGQATGQPCDLSLQMFSPLVLDFSGASMLTSIPLSESKVKFDLDANGHKENTGWIPGIQSAFLVLDRNENGTIDDGGELFGNASYSSKGQTFDNGFLALGQYDRNLDGKISSEDEIFRKLKLWFDRNSNGSTDKGELVALESRSIVTIDLNYQKVPRHLALAASDFFPNDVRYVTQFTDKLSCQKGCPIYDIFFGTSTSISMNK